MKIVDFGISPYRREWERQKNFQKAVIDGRCKGNSDSIPEVIMVGEHSPVYTIGFHGDIANLIVDERNLKELGCECIRIERGGDITFHGPGQLILYPIIDLIRHKLGVKEYVEILEECVIRLLREYGISGERISGATGVWIGKGSEAERKICAIGVKISHGVTMHGLALNVDTDLRFFSKINPCGFTNKGVTSMSNEIKSPVLMGDLKKRIIEIFLTLIGGNY